MEKIVIRAATFFTGRSSNIKEEYQLGVEVLSRISEIAKELNLEVFTRRISMPSLSMDELVKLPDIASDKDILVSAGYVSLRRIGVRDAEYLTSNGVYIPVLPSLEDFMIDDARYFSRIIHGVAENDPLNATRIAIGFHNESFCTPYFPDSSSRGVRSIGLSFLYPDMLEANDISALSNSIRDAFRLFNNIAQVIENSIGYPVSIDYSLSPWMEKSVVKILESLGYSLLEPGFNYILHVINNLIQEHYDPRRAIGFNEVMLPYAEDSLLIKYGGMGLIRARDFLRYASTCVAGVDMIIVPSSIEKLARLVMDTYSLGLVKSKPIALRAIPVNNKPGEKISLGKFGESFVIEY